MATKNLDYYLNKMPDHLRYINFSGVERSTMGKEGQKVKEHVRLVGGVCSLCGEREISGRVDSMIRGRHDPHGCSLLRPNRTVKKGDYLKYLAGRYRTQYPPKVAAAHD